MNTPYDPAAHYDRVTPSWTVLLGDDLHYGVFRRPDEPLELATANLTRLMVEAAQIVPDVEVLDVGCGTGAPACALARLGATVVGITTSEVGREKATARAAREGLGRRARFDLRDGTDNGFDDASFDRVWVLESSHLMPDRDALIRESARVLRPGGRLALCDIVLRRPMPFEEVRRLRGPLALLRAVFGGARMEPLTWYEAAVIRHGLELQEARDLTQSTFPTFEAWRTNAERHREQAVAELGDDDWQRFVEACDVLSHFWQDGTLGYALLAASKPVRR